MVPANQGSRGALVTWTVVTTILFVAATIFAIYYYVEASRVATEAETTSKKFREIVTEAQLNSPEVAALKELRSNPENEQKYGFNGSMSLLDVAMKQRDDLAKRIAVSPDFLKAMQGTDRLMIDVTEKSRSAGVEKLPDTSLNDAITALTDALVSRSNEANKLREDLTSAQKAQEEAANQLAAARKAMDDQLAAVRASETSTLDASSADRTAKDQQIVQLQADFEGQMRGSQEAGQQLQVQIADAQRANDQLKGEIQKLQAKLAGMRVNVADPVVRQADGQIVRIPGGDVVYINLGQGDQVSAGMTFQVFDKVEGVPPAGDPTTIENLPTGKASIEVVRVGPTSSECRVIRRQPGQTLTDGDLIANLVYDRNTRYNFLVFGNFDLDRNNVPTAQDAEVVKRLVTQWGGRLTDKVNVDTDFVVLGAEPQVPTFSPGELDDPLNQAKFDQARADADAYEEVRRLAQEYNIPVLNQNRFLYFVGFYELSKR